MFALSAFPAVAIKAGIKIVREGFRYEQLAFVKRAERYGTGGIRAFMKHWLGPVFSQN